MAFEDTTRQSPSTFNGYRLASHPLFWLASKLFPRALIRLDVNRHITDAIIRLQQTVLYTVRNLVPFPDRDLS